MEETTANLNEQLTDQALVTSLRSETCPSCGGKKKYRHTLCVREYMALPREMRVALYRPLGAGYKEAVHNAFIFLDRVEFKLPPAATARA